MSPELILFILRLVAALALLLFMALIAWLIFKDMKAAADSKIAFSEQSGLLIVVGDELSPIPNGSSFPLLPVTSIGRAQSNTIVIEEDFVSNHHALLSLRAKQWWVEDLGSRNGTSLNDLTLESPTVLSEGDIIAIGHTKIRIKL